jgi:hypothetical protein
VYKLVLFSVHGRAPVSSGFPVSSLQHSVHPQVTSNVKKFASGHRIAKRTGSSETHSVVNVEMFPMAVGRVPTIDAFSRDLFATAIQLLRITTLKIPKAGRTFSSRKVLIICSEINQRRRRKKKRIEHSQAYDERTAILIAGLIVRYEATDARETLHSAPIGICVRCDFLAAREYLRRVPSCQVALRLGSACVPCSPQSLQGIHCQATHRESPNQTVPPI